MLRTANILASSRVLPTASDRPAEEARVGSTSFVRLQSRAATENAQNTVCWIQISGASILAIPDVAQQRFGEAFGHRYNDYGQVSEIISLIEKSPARAVDQAILSTARELGSRVCTAILFPPIIYGLGRGQGNRDSIQIPGLCKVAIEQKTAVYVGRGEATCQYRMC